MEVNDRRKQLQHQRREAFPARFILYRARHNAKTKGIECSLSLQDIPEIPEFCPVFSWIKLQYRVGGMGRGFKYPDTPSLDRIDNSIGYVPGNIRIISWRANELKGNAEDREIAALAEDIKSKLNPKIQNKHEGPQCKCGQPMKPFQRVCSVCWKKAA